MARRRAMASRWWACAVVTLACVLMVPRVEANSNSSDSGLLSMGRCVEAGPLGGGWVTTTGLAWQCCEGCGEIPFPVIAPGSCSGPTCTTRNNPLLHEVVQDVDVSGMAAGIDAGSVAFVFHARMRTYCGIDTAEVAMTFLDAAGASLAVHQSCRYKDTAWGTSVQVETPPANTRVVRVHLLAAARGGTETDGFFHNLTLHACTVGTDCPAPETLVCLNTKTSVASGPGLDQLMLACDGLYGTASAAGVEFPVVKRTGYCTTTCAAEFNAFTAELNAAIAPVCPEYDVIEAILIREQSLANRECKNPVSNTFIDNSGTSSRPSLLLMLLAAAAAAVLAASAAAV